MNLRKATIRIVLAFVSVIAVGGLIASCSTEEFEGPRKTLATRSTMGTEPGVPNENSRWKITDSFLGNISFDDKDSIFNFEVPIEYNSGEVYPDDRTGLHERGSNVLYCKRLDMTGKYDIEVVSFNSQIHSPLKWYQSADGRFAFNVIANITYEVNLYPILEIKTHNDSVTIRKPDWDHPQKVERSLSIEKTHFADSQPF